MLGHFKCIEINIVSDYPLGLKIRHGYVDKLGHYKSDVAIIADQKKKLEETISGNPNYTSLNADFLDYY